MISLEYIIPDKKYIVSAEQFNQDNLDKPGISLNIENKSSKDNIIAEIQKDKRDFLEGTIKKEKR